MADPKIKKKYWMKYKVGSFARDNGANSISQYLPKIGNVIIL